MRRFWDYAQLTFQINKFNKLNKLKIIYNFFIFFNVVLTNFCMVFTSFCVPLNLSLGLKEGSCYLI